MLSTYLNSSKIGVERYAKCFAPSISSISSLRNQRKLYQRQTIRMAGSEVSTNQAPAPFGPYSQGVKSGSTIYVAGQIGVNPGEKTLLDGVEAQAERALKNLESVVVAGGGTKSSIVKTTVLMADLEEFAAVNKIYGAFFEGCDVLPARSTYAVKSLPLGARIEIEAVAEV